MLRLWRAFQAGHLPEPGGSLDQAAAMLEAFAVMGAAEAELLREARGRGDGRGGRET